MNKPIVFFSHSSKDEKSMRRLKEMIDSKTGQSISIFLTSDGQSIPFGQNWVHKVEEALRQTSLMFVFVSPNSIQSNWIYFEAGYAYSKDIKVVPVGVLGLDLAHMRPPLSLLQGFNLDKRDALGNIIAIVNETYKVKFDTTFENENFDYIFQDENVIKSAGFLSLFHLTLKSEDGNTLRETIAKKFEGLNIETIISNGNLRSNGVEIRAQSTDPNLTHIFIDGLLGHVYLPFVQDILNISDVEFMACSAELENNYLLISNSLRRSALLKGTGIRMADGEKLDFKGIAFLVFEKHLVDRIGRIPIVIDTKTNNIFPTLEWFGEVTRILFESGVIY